MIWENWERDVVLVENILLYFVIVITFVAFVIVLGCSCYKFFRYRQCFLNSYWDNLSQYISKTTTGTCRFFNRINREKNTNTTENTLTNPNADFSSTRSSDKPDEEMETSTQLDSPTPRDQERLPLVMIMRMIMIMMIEEQ